MSRDVFSKNKEKRARTSSGESNNSFVKNVTSRVSGLLPATITKWFSSPSSSNANGSAPAADATDSSTDDEAPEESPITTQPPAKRMRFSSGPGYETEENCITNNIETIETTTSVRHETSSYTVQSPPGRTTFRRETNFVSTPIRSPEESTIETTETDTTTMFPQHTVSTITSSVTKKRKSLFGNQSQEMIEASKRACAKTASNTTKDLKQPAFKPALLGSPFYAGRTTYGGAASSYINQPNITQRQNTTVKESTTNTDNTISHSARRVMELLESYSSPLAEAKRIPHYTRPTRQEMMKRFSESSSVSPYSKPNSYKTQELHLPSVASILRLKQRSRLNDTTNAARQIIASHSSSSPDYLTYPSSSRSDRTEMDSSNKLTTKVKSRLTRPYRGDNKSLDTDTIAPLELPKAVLQINPNNLPKFSTPILTKKKSSIETPPLSVIRFEPKSTPVETKSKPETISRDHIYNFAHPVSITRESLKTNSTPPKFTFGSPERKIDSKFVTEVKSSAPTIVLDTKKDASKPMSAAASWKDASKPMTAAENWQDASKPMTAAASWKDASKPMTAAANCKDASKPMNATASWKDASKPMTEAASWKDASKPTTAAASWKDASKPTTAAASWNDASKPTTEAANWNCPDCWANNKPESAKCVCCGCVKAAQVAAKPKCSLCKVADCLADKDKCVICEKVQVNNIIKPLNAGSPKWQCKSCWVDNKETDEKCVCCGEKNPKASNAAPNTVITKKPDASAAGMCPKCFGCTTFGKCSKCADLVSIPSTNLDNVIKAQANKWECEHCLVRNDSDKTKCLCCEADRPGAFKQPEKKQFNFGTMNTSFKFGIDPKVQEANLAKVAENKDKEEESETNNNVLAKAPSFSFGIPAKTPEDKTNAARSVLDEAPKPTFSFGQPKQNSIAPTSLPKFGISNKPAETSKDKVDCKEPQETKKAEEAKSPVMFGASMPATNTSTTSPPSVIAVGSFATAKKDVPSNLISLPNTNADVPKSTAFSAPKPEGGLFGIASTSLSTPLSTTTSFTANTTQASSANMFQKTDAPKMSLFQAPKSDPPTTATVSLFQKSEAAATAPPPAATAPLFSFGGGQTAQPAPEKPKFNFAYFTGGSKNEVFKPSTFGTPNDSNTSGVKFTLGNTTENPLAVNSLATANNLTGNGLNPSLVSGNSMLVNPLAASSSMAPGTGLQAASSNMFSTAPKENMWSTTSNSTANLFSANTTSNSAPKPFSFGSSTPFSSNPTAFGASSTSATPAFGSNIQATPTPAFGSAAQPTPSFGAPAQGAPAPSFGSVQSAATPHIFGVPNQNNQPSMFSTPNQNSAMFGSPQPAAGGMQPPSMGMFGRPSVGATPTFGTPSSMPNFEAPSHAPAQPPAFNFVAPQPSGMFGFGQQQQQPQPQGLGGGQGVYSFGAAAAPAQSGVQFSMGSAPNAGVRRIRKARRSQPR